MTQTIPRAGREGVVAGVAGTVLAHALFVLLVFLATRQTPLQGTVYAIKLVAAPAPTEARRAAAEAVPRPVERTAPIDPPARTRPPPPPTKTVPRQRTEAAPQTANPATPMAGETPSTGSDVANVETPGVEFPFPEYLRHIVNEVYRRWQRPVGPYQTLVTFLIFRDGTVREIKVATRSRSMSFDLSAQGAVEAAANAGAFGPLPEGFPSDVLAISLWFKPQGSR